MWSVFCYVFVLYTENHYKDEYGWQYSQVIVSSIHIKSINGCWITEVSCAYTEHDIARQVTDVLLLCGSSHWLMISCLSALQVSSPLGGRKLLQQTYRMSLILHRCPLLAECWEGQLRSPMKSLMLPYDLSDIKI